MLRFAARRLPDLGRRRVMTASQEAEVLMTFRNFRSVPEIPPPKPSPMPCFGPPAASNSWVNPYLVSFSLNHCLRERSGFACDFVRGFSSVNQRDDLDEAALEEEAEKKVGWLLKLIFIVTAVGVGLQFFPYMGDNLLQQSISLLLVKDPLFKRMGASRLSRFAVDDERRMKVVEMGGAQELLNMLEAAKDDKTRKFALKALVALSHSDAAAEALRQAGAVPIVSSTPDSVEYAEVEKYKCGLLKRFADLKPDFSTCSRS